MFPFAEERIGSINSFPETEFHAYWYGVPHPNYSFALHDDV
jgi:hypothetical protein